MPRPDCPWCGRTMDPGELESMRAINWYPSEIHASAKGFLSWKGIKELCAPVTGNIQTPKRDRWENSSHRLPAYHCPDCDRFVIMGRVKA